MSLSKSLLGKAIRYALNEWTKLLVNLEDGRVPIDNNLVENAIRPFVVGRKNWLFSGSPDGARTGAAFYSLIETAKASGHKPYRHLLEQRYVGDRLSKDDEVFLFEKLFDKLDISAIMKSCSSEGGSMFSPGDQLAVILFAFHKGITSSVKIAELIRYYLQFIYLAGGHIIKRRAICDFRLKHIGTVKQIFISSISLAAAGRL